MLETLQHIDRELFTAVNSGMQSTLLDIICPFARKQSNWYLIYALLGYFVYEKYRSKCLWILLGAGLLVLTTDQLSAHLVKNLVQRLRPCNDPSMQVRLLVHCGSGFSFFSAHATNHFAIAVFLSLFFKEHKWALPLGLVWAAVIAFSQVYVGVHYPFDVLCGAVFGSAFGYLFYRIISARLTPKTNTATVE